MPGIRYVVDTGLARISRYSLKTKVQRLPIEAISQASARQRSGRCGRVEAGIAIRLYAEEDFEGRPEFTDPEILRTNLASVILQMTSLGLGDVGRFPFVEPPDRRNVSAGVQLLEELGALVSTARPTGGAGRADQGRPAAGAAADRPPARPDDPGGRAARLRPRDPRHRRRALAAGPPRAAAGGAGPGRPAARPLQGPDLRLPVLAEPLAPPARPAARAVVERLPADVQAGVPQLPAGPRVAGLRVPAASGVPGAQGRARQGAGVVSTPLDHREGLPTARREPARRTTRTGSTRRSCRGCCPTSACSRSGNGSRRARPEKRRGRAARGSTSGPGARGSRSSPGAGCGGRTRRT